MIDALAAASGRDVSRETYEKLQAYADLLAAESKRQNLIAASTRDQMWQRHILDSAQLAGHVPREAHSLVDVGSGAGLPGVVLALLTELPTMLIEPRRLRAEFLGQVVEALGMAGMVTVAATKVEKVEGRFDVITARAVAALDTLLGLTRSLSHDRTIWLLPKGRNVKSELAQAQRSWHCQVVSKRSITDPDAEILVISKLRAKG